MIRFNVFPDAIEGLEWDANELAERMALKEANKGIQPFVLLLPNERVVNIERVRDMLHELRYSLARSSWTFSGASNDIEAIIKELGIE